MTVSATATNTRLSYSILIMLCKMPTLSFCSKTAHQDQEDGWNERNYNDKEWKIIGANKRSPFNYDSRMVCPENRAAIIMSNI